MKRYLCLLSCLTSLALQAEVFFTPEMVSSHLKGYSEQEVLLIEKDLKVVRSVCVDDTHNSDHRYYLATAGSPGSRKTTILEKFVAAHPEYQEGVYLDPDPRTLKFMVHTYYAQSLSPLAIASNESYDFVIKSAYEKWRGASNYIVLTLLEEAFAQGRSIVYGTTSTGGHIPSFFAKLKENDYEIILLLCSCPDDMRYKAVDYRNHEVRFFQSTPEDAVSKGKLFPQRMQAYFAAADQMYFYWSDSLDSKERLAGVWHHGKLEIHDKEAMQNFIDKYEEDRNTLAAEGKVIPSFSTFLAE